METKSNVDWMKVIRDRCGFKKGFFVPSVGCSGGLALFWESDVVIHVLGSSPSCIDAIIKGGSNFIRSHLTGFYGNPDTSKRVESWQLLKSISSTSQQPWLIIGDFNEIRRAEKKEGGAARPVQQMVRFKNSIDYCWLKELDFVGPVFTWIYQRGDGYQIQEILDCALVSSDWAMLFPKAWLFHKSISVSDHCPLVLKFFEEQKRGRHKKLFRFESMWLKDSKCEGIVTSAWNEGLSDTSYHPI